MGLPCPRRGTLSQEISCTLKPIIMRTSGAVALFLLVALASAEQSPDSIVPELMTPLAEELVQIEHDDNADPGASVMHAMVADVDKDLKQRAKQCHGHVKISAIKYKHHKVKDGMITLHVVLERRSPPNRSRAAEEYIVKGSSPEPGKMLVESVSPSLCEWEKVDHPVPKDEDEKGDTSKRVEKKEDAYKAEAEKQKAKEEHLKNKLTELRRGNAAPHATTVSALETAKLHKRRPRRQHKEHKRRPRRQHKETLDEAAHKLLTTGHFS